MATTNLAALRNPASQTPVVTPGFETAAGFEALQRMAHLFHQSNVVPDRFSLYSKTFNEKMTFGNTVIALDMALRMHANPLMVFQNLYVVNGNPSWSSQFLIATFNQCGRFSALRYEFEGTPGQDNWGCKAVATELATGAKLEGTLITIGMAKREGWYGKSSSKWQSMPEQMLRYRAAAWFIRVYAPEIAMGLRTVEEVRDTIEMEQAQDGSFVASEQQKTSMTVEEVKAAAQAQQAPAPKQEQPAEPQPEKKRTRKPKAEAAPVQQPEPQSEPEPIQDAQEVPPMEEPPIEDEYMPEPPMEEPPAEEPMVEENIKRFHQECVSRKLSQDAMIGAYWSRWPKCSKMRAMNDMGADEVIFATVEDMVKEAPGRYSTD